MACSTSLATSATHPGRCEPIVLLLVIVALVLGGCGGMSRNDRPATVEDRSQPGTSTTPTVRTAPSPATTPAAKAPEIAAYRPPAAPQYRRPEPNRAVASLVRRADDQERAGDHAAAAVSLERALRIAPDDAALWSRLAALRLEQQQYGSVQQLAAKSNALAAVQDADLKARNWRLIADARRALGDDTGASDAERRAAELEQ